MKWLLHQFNITSNHKIHIRKEFSVSNAFWIQPKKKFWKNFRKISKSKWGQFWPKIDIKLLKNWKFWKTNAFIVFLKEKQHILRYYMIMYATIKENQFLTPSTPQKRAKNAKKSNPLNVPLEMTHSYHLIPKICL